MTKFRGFVLGLRAKAFERPWLFGLVVLIILYISWKQFGGSRSEAVNYLVIYPSDFVKEVSVSGKVVAAQNVDLGFDQSGRVSGVYAKVGDVVGVGAVLASVENGDLRADLLQKQAALQTEQAKLKSSQQGTRPEQLAVTESSVASAESVLNQANLSLFNSIRDAYTKSDDAVRGKVDLFITNPRSSSPQLQFNFSDSQLAIQIVDKRLKIEAILTEWQKDNSAPLNETNLIMQASKSQDSLSLISSLLDDSSAALNLASAGGSLSQSTVDTYKSNILTARTNINTSISSLTTAMSTQKSATSALVTAKGNLRLEQAGSTEEDISAQVARVKSAEADVLNAQAKLRKSQVFAPFTGVVTKMDAKAGEVVSPGVSKISMISTDAFQIESFVPEVQIAFLKLDNSGLVTLDAYGDNAPFWASIISIDPAETIRDGVSTYKIKLQFKTADPRIKSGMTANITITAEKKPNVISVPQGIVVEKNGKQYVSVLSGKETVEREIETGSVSSLGQIEVLKGLGEGDTVLLKPADN